MKNAGVGSAAVISGCSQGGDGYQTVTPADDTVAATPDPSDPASTVVEDGANLQSALSTNDVVHVSGTVIVDQTITVPKNKIIVGNGKMASATIIGDGVQGDVNGPLLKVESEAKVLGHGIVNKHPEGTAVGLNGWTPDVIQQRHRLGQRCN
jgi:PBP1b-binding outer membrane lipoprotein LpoB